MSDTYGTIRCDFEKNTAIYCLPRFVKFAAKGQNFMVSENSITLNFCTEYVLNNLNEMKDKCEVKKNLKLRMKAPNVIAKPLKEQRELEPCRKFALNVRGHSFFISSSPYGGQNLTKISPTYNSIIK